MKVLRQLQQAEGDPAEAAALLGDHDLQTIRVEERTFPLVWARRPKERCDEARDSYPANIDAYDKG